MAYLMKAGNLSYPDALRYTTNLGQETPVIKPHTPKDTLQRLATYYCNAIGGSGCPGKADTGSSQGLVSAGTTIPTLPVTPVLTPQQTMIPAPAQTMVPVKPYNPASDGDTQF